jgi:hypothetical protein
MRSKEQRLALWVVLALILGTLLLFGRAVGFDFINVDDGDYVFNNAHLNQGFSTAGT